MSIIETTFELKDDFLLAPRLFHDTTFSQHDYAMTAKVLYCFISGERLFHSLPADGSRACDLSSHLTS